MDLRNCVPVKSPCLFLSCFRPWAAFQGTRFQKFQVSCTCTCRRERFVELGEASNRGDPFPGDMQCMFICRVAAGLAHRVVFCTPAAPKGKAVVHPRGKAASPALFTIGQQGDQCRFTHVKASKEDGEPTLSGARGSRPLCSSTGSGSKLRLLQRQQRRCRPFQAMASRRCARIGGDAPEEPEKKKGDEKATA